jgi:hypothetical protein
VSGELGLRWFLDEAGHTLVVTSDKEGPDSVFDRELPDAEWCSLTIWADIRSGVARIWYGLGAGRGTGGQAGQPERRRYVVGEGEMTMNVANHAFSEGKPPGSAGRMSAAGRAGRR